MLFKPHDTDFSRPEVRSRDVERNGPFALFCADNAHVWTLYMERSKIFDKQLANVLNSDLDPLLIFVSLYFCVVSPK
jgi:hypothetical protein